MHVSTVAVLTLVCLRQDAEDVIELLKMSLIDVCTDEFGLVDFSRR
jgi:hypothetical protein